MRISPGSAGTKVTADRDHVQVKWRLALAALALVELVLGGGVAWATRSHDRQIDRFERAMRALPLPEGAVVITRGATISDGYPSHLPEVFRRDVQEHCSFRIWLDVDTAGGIEGVRATTVLGQGVSVGRLSDTRVRVSINPTAASGWDPRCRRGL